MHPVSPRFGRNRIGQFGIGKFASLAAAERFEVISYQQVLEKGLRVMDATAVVLCMENHIPIVVFDMTQQGNLRRVLMGEELGSIVKEVC